MDSLLDWLAFLEEHGGVARRKPMITDPEQMVAFLRKIYPNGT